MRELQLVIFCFSPLNKSVIDCCTRFSSLKILMSASFFLLGLLIATLEAHELLYEGVKRRWKEAKRRALEGGEDLDTALAGLDSPERLDEKLMAAIEKNILTVGGKLQVQLLFLCFPSWDLSVHTCFILPALPYSENNGGVFP